MKFSHIADCHIGSWRDDKIRHASMKAFLKAIELSIKEEVDFILISGDLFNTALPAIDKLKRVVQSLKKLKDLGIEVYVVPGSHDFSHTGKTMLDVLEHAGLFNNVVKGEVIYNKLRLKFTIDKKTGAKITGMLGKKGMLEKKFYHAINKEELEKEPGFKIFMFHTAITELKPKELDKMASAPVSLLPKGFDYYAGGHVHIVKEANLDGYKNIVYPGPLFPNNFREIEELGTGGFYIYDDGNIRYEPLQVLNTHSILIECNHKTPQEAEQEIYEKIKSKEFNNTIVTIRLKGILKHGKASEINFRDIFTELYSKSAYFVMKSTALLKSQEFEEVKVQSDSVEEIEEALIKEHLGQKKIEGMSTEKEKEMIQQLLRVLSTEKAEGETKTDFEKRVKEESSKALGVHEVLK